MFLLFNDLIVRPNRNRNITTSLIGNSRILKFIYSEYYLPRVYRRNRLKLVIDIVFYLLVFYTITTMRIAMSQQDELSNCLVRRLCFKECSRSNSDSKCVKYRHPFQIEDSTYSIGYYYQEADTMSYKICSDFYNKNNNKINKNIKSSLNPAPNQHMDLCVPLSKIKILDTFIDKEEKYYTKQEATIISKNEFESILTQKNGVYCVDESSSCGFQELQNSTFWQFFTDFSNIEKQINHAYARGGLFLYDLLVFTQQITTCRNMDYSYIRLISELAGHITALLFIIAVIVFTIIIILETNSSNLKATLSNSGSIIVRDQILVIIGLVLIIIYTLIRQVIKKDKLNMNELLEVLDHPSQYSNFHQNFNLEVHSFNEKRIKFSNHNSVSAKSKIKADESITKILSHVKGIDENELKAVKRMLDKSRREDLINNSTDTEIDILWIMNKDCELFPIQDISRLNIENPKEKQIYDDVTKILNTPGNRLIDIGEHFNNSPEILESILKLENNENESIQELVKYYTNQLTKEEKTQPISEKLYLLERIKNRIKRITISSEFDRASLNLVVIYGSYILISIVFDSILTEEQKELAEIGDSIFLGIFVIEVILRFISSGYRYFLNIWPVIDTVIVLSSVIGKAALNKAGSILGVLRLLRLIRLFTVCQRHKSEKRPSMGKNGRPLDDVNEIIESVLNLEEISSKDKNQLRNILTMINSRTLYALALPENKTNTDFEKSKITQELAGWLKIIKNIEPNNILRGTCLESVRPSWEHYADRVILSQVANFAIPDDEVVKTLSQLGEILKLSFSTLSTEKERTELDYSQNTYSQEVMYQSLQKISLYTIRGIFYNDSLWSSYLLTDVIEIRESLVICTMDAMACFDIFSSFSLNLKITHDWILYLYRGYSPLNPWHNTRKILETLQFEVLTVLQFAKAAETANRLNQSTSRDFFNVSKNVISNETSDLKSIENIQETKNQIELCSEVCEYKESKESQNDTLNDEEYLDMPYYPKNWINLAYNHYFKNYISNDNKPPVSYDSASGQIPQEHLEFIESKSEKINLPNSKLMGLEPEECFALIIVALFIDFCHPGTTEDFIVKKCKNISSVYADENVIVNLSLSMAFSLSIALNEKSPFAVLSEASYRKIKYLVLSWGLSSRGDKLPDFPQFELETTSDSYGWNGLTEKCRTDVLGTIVSCAVNAGSSYFSDPFIRHCESIVSEWTREADILHYGSTDSKDLSIPIYMNINLEKNEMYETLLIRYKLIVLPRYERYFEIISLIMQRWNGFSEKYNNRILARLVKNMDQLKRRSAQSTIYYDQEM